MKSSRKRCSTASWTSSSSPWKCSWRKIKGSWGRIFTTLTQRISKWIIFWFDLLMWVLTYGDYWEKLWKAKLNCPMIWWRELTSDIYPFIAFWLPIPRPRTRPPPPQQPRSADLKRCWKKMANLIICREVSVPPINKPIQTFFKSSNQIKTQFLIHKKFDK